MRVSGEKWLLPMAAYIEFKVLAVALSKKIGYKHAAYYRIKTVEFITKFVTLMFYSELKNCKTFEKLITHEFLLFLV